MDQRGASGPGELLRRHRLRVGVDQQELAGRAGLSVRALRDIEHGRVRRPRAESVQRLADASAVASFGAIEEVVGQSILEDDDVAAPIDLDDDDYDSSEESGVPRMAQRRSRRDVDSYDDEEAIAGVADLAPMVDLARLKGVLEDLIACRRLLDAAIKDG